MLAPNRLDRLAASLAYRPAVATQKPAPDLDRTPDLGEGRDRDLVWVWGPLGAHKPTPDFVPDPPRTLPGSGDYQDLVLVFWSTPPGGMGMGRPTAQWSRSGREFMSPGASNPAAKARNPARPGDGKCCSGVRNSRPGTDPARGREIPPSGHIGKELAAAISRLSCRLARNSSRAKPSGLGAMDVPKPHKFTWLGGSTHGRKPL